MAIAEDAEAPTLRGKSLAPLMGQEAH
jgi:hypothetical protein